MIWRDIGVCRRDDVSHPRNIRKGTMKKTHGETTMRQMVHWRKASDVEDNDRDGKHDNHGGRT